MQANSTLFCMLYICIRAPSTWVLLRVTKGLRKITFELIIRILTKQSYDPLIWFISVRITKQLVMYFSYFNYKCKIITCSDVSQPLYVDIF